MYGDDLHSCYYPANRELRLLGMGVDSRPHYVHTFYANQLELIPFFGSLASDLYSIIVLFSLVWYSVGKAAYLGDPILSSRHLGGLSWSSGYLDSCGE